MCVTSGGTNFSKLANIKVTDAPESLSSSIGMLQSAVNQQGKTLQPFRYESKTAICIVTRSCPRTGGTDLEDVSTIDTVQIAVFAGYAAKGLKGLRMLIHSVQIEELELSVRNSLSRAGQLAVVPYMELESWFHLTSRT